MPERYAHRCGDCPGCECGEGCDELCDRDCYCPDYERAAALGDDPDGGTP